VHPSASRATTAPVETLRTLTMVSCPVNAHRSTMSVCVGHMVKFFDSGLLVEKLPSGTEYRDWTGRGGGLGGGVGGGGAGGGLGGGIAAQVPVTT
jgi:hypothetical protein